MKSAKFTGPLQLDVEYHPWELEVKKHLKGTCWELQAVSINIDLAKVDRGETARKLLSLSERILAAAKAAQENDDEE